MAGEDGRMGPGAFGDAGEVWVGRGEKIEDGRWTDWEEESGREAFAGRAAREAGAAEEPAAEEWGAAGRAMIGAEAWDSAEGGCEVGGDSGVERGPEGAPDGVGGLAVVGVGVDG